MHRLGRDGDIDVVAAGHPVADVDLLVIASDGADDASPAMPPGAPWLPVRIDFGVAVIGPVAVPGIRGCPTCARSRADKARADAPLRRAVRTRYADRVGVCDVRLTSQGADVVAELVAGEVGGLLTPFGRGMSSVGPAPARTRCGVVRVRLDTLSTGVHRFLPEPDCRDCGGLPDDAEESGRFDLVSRTKLAPDTYRVVDLLADRDRLVDAYVDPETGLIRGLDRTGSGTYPNTSAPMGLRDDHDEVETGFGRDLVFVSSEVTAIAEAVERYGGVRPGARRTVVRGSYRQLANRALDPKTLGLYPDERHLLPGFGYQRYHDDLDVRWVWAHSFARGGPVLVPESYAYYRVASHHGENDTYRPFVYEISNGCAIGGCLEEAILHGIVELAERDAFLLTWYARLPVPELDLNSAVDRRLPLMAERLRHDLGYDVHIFDTTTEHGIPSVWAMAVHPSDDDDVPKMLCAAGAGFVPERAIANALLELAPMVEWRRATYADEKERAERMLTEPDEVRSMHDHSLVNAHRRALDRTTFLLGRTDRHDIAGSFAGSFRPRNADLTVDLRATVDRFLERGQDVIVVDQTTPEHVTGRFACVKVIIPGLLPMTFGHRMRRVDGLPRLVELPYSLGHVAAPLQPEDINPFPHPFP